MAALRGERAADGSGSRSRSRGGKGGWRRGRGAVAAEVGGGGAEREGSDAAPESHPFPPPCSRLLVASPGGRRAAGDGGGGGGGLAGLVASTLRCFPPRGERMGWAGASHNLMLGFWPIWKPGPVRPLFLISTLRCVQDVEFPCAQKDVELCLKKDVEFPVSQEKKMWNFIYLRRTTKRAL